MIFLSDDRMVSELLRLSTSCASVAAHLVLLMRQRVLPSRCDQAYWPTKRLIHEALLLRFAERSKKPADASVLSKRKFSCRTRLMFYGASLTATISMSIQPTQKSPDSVPLTSSSSKSGAQRFRAMLAARNLGNRARGR